MRLPTYLDVRRFCAVDGWEEKAKRARRKGGDHYASVKTLDDGQVLYVQVSRGSGAYGDPNLVRFMFREELKVTAAEFWLAVDKGIPPARGRASQSHDRQDESVPYDLVRNLTTRAGYSLDEVLQLGKLEAVRAWNEFLTEGGPDSK
ncbi:MAG: hypothetical protein NTW96_27260 [Planctomycetia bacterium]|nr:hypothetical protein [Planctomycetia bacterium]